VSDDLRGIEPVTAWDRVLKIVCAGHAIGFLFSEAASLNAPMTLDWLQIAAVLFVLGFFSALGSSIAARTVYHYRENSPVAAQLAAGRLIIAFLLAFCSVVTFFSACATAILSFFQVLTPQTALSTYVV